MRNLARKFTVPSWTVPWALLGLCLLSFGLFIPWLGFYWDDWPVLLISRLQGIQGFRDFYLFDRPLSAWTYILFTPLLGTRPAPWHVFSLLLRWLAVMGMWWSLRLLWPQRRREATWMAILFAIYPIFDQQPIAVAYSQHWISYSLYFLSLGAMLLSLRTSQRANLCRLLSLAAAALHLFTMEYFLGLELLRPLFLWLVVGENIKPLRTRARQVSKLWSPYFLLVTVYIIWRLFFLDLAGEDPNRPEVLYDLFSQPLPALVALFQTMLRDVIFFLAGSWYRTVRPVQITLLQPVFLLSMTIAILSAVGIALFLLRLKTNPAINIFSQRPWIRQTVLVGIAAIILGTLPAWLTGRETIQGLYGTRFGLGAMFGASLLLVGLLEWFTSRHLQKVFIISILVGLAVGFHLRTANDFRWLRIDQNRFYWQLYWRAPSLKPGTAILSDGELFPYVGTYSTAAALNLLYPQPDDSPALAYWFFDLDRDFGPQEIARLDRDIRIDTTFRSFAYTGTSLNSLVISYEPQEGRCLRVLSPSTTGNLEFSDLSRRALLISNLNRIGLQTDHGDYPPVEIFGDEPPRTWCYFYQKAELARQTGDWQAIAKLGDQVEMLGHAPEDPQEWWPFIKAYANINQWEKAKKLTLRAFQNDADLKPGLCSLWSQFEQRGKFDVRDNSPADLLVRHLQCTS